MRKTILALVAMVVFSGLCPGDACAQTEKKQADDQAEKIAPTQEEKANKEEPKNKTKKKSKGKGEKPGPVAGANGVDSRIKLTPVTDGSLDWKYKPTLANLNLLRPSERLHILQIPDWVPVDKREDPEAKYYLYHSNHGGGSIKMHWAKSIEEIVSGNVRSVTLRNGQK